MTPILLKYGNTNTYAVGGLLIDTDMAGTLPALWRELKKQGIAKEAIRYVMATHYHPDHIGLIGELMQTGVRLLLFEHQLPHVHASDAIYARMKSSPFVPIDESQATVIPCDASRAFLSELGIDGEIVPTKSHSADGAALVLDSGHAIVGDLEPYAYLSGYPENKPLRADWETLFSHHVTTVSFAHVNDQKMQ